MNLEDKLSDEEKENVEKAEEKSRREGTKYGGMLNDND